MLTFIRPQHQRFVAFLVAATCILGMTAGGLLVPLLTGMLAYQTVFYWSPKLIKSTSAAYQQREHRARTMAGTLLAAAIVAGLGGLIVGVHYAVGDGASIRALLMRLSEIVQSAKAGLPAVIAGYIPEKDSLLTEAGDWLKAHAGILSSMGLNTLKGIGLALLGVILGVMIAIAQPATSIRRGPVTDLLVEQIVAFRSYFWHVASAQVKISAINTSCTAAYLYIVLPLFGVDLHMKAALVGITFAVGLMPVVGNLVANTILTVIGLDHSILVAATSLLFAVVIHKLEYIWSGRIIGTKVDARVWELITSMLLLEHFLGVPGLVIAPIFYSWLKNEWRSWDKHFNHAETPVDRA